MGATPSFTEAVREIASGLRENAPHHTRLNRAASEIDQAGRKLHGLGLAHDREIADCFTAAIRELSASHTLPEEKRAETVRQAVSHLEAALGHAGSEEVDADSGS